MNEVWKVHNDVGCLDFALRMLRILQMLEVLVRIFATSLSGWCS